MRFQALAWPWCSSRITNMYSNEVSSTTIIERPTQYELQTMKADSAPVQTSSHRSTSTSACSSKPASNAETRPIVSCEDTALSRASSFVIVDTHPAVAAASYEGNAPIELLCLNTPGVRSPHDCDWSSVVSLEESTPSRGDTPSPSTPLRDSSRTGIVQACERPEPRPRQARAPGTQYSHDGLSSVPAGLVASMKNSVMTA